MADHLRGRRHDASDHPARILPGDRPEITSLLLVMTSTCNIRCGHCCMSAGPDRRDVLPHRKFLAAMDGLHRRGIRSLAVSGGEPTLYMDVLASLVGKAVELRWDVILDTNASWASRAPVARATVARFKDMGLRNVRISTGRYHQKFVPVRTVKKAADLLRKSAMNARITYLIDRASGDGERKKARELGARYDVCWNRLLPVGRAAALPESVTAYDVAWDERLRSCRCHRHLNGLVIDYNGEVFRCCQALYPVSGKTSPCFHFGNILTEPLDGIWRRCENFGKLYALLYAQGPAGVYRRLRRRLEGEGFRKKPLYYSPCELCMDIGNGRYFPVVQEYL